MARRLGVQHSWHRDRAGLPAFLDMLPTSFAPPGGRHRGEHPGGCRGILLMAVSNKTGRILLTTGNKSEMSVGYASSTVTWRRFAPSRTSQAAVYRWRSAQRSGGDPRGYRPPASELRSDQKDSDSCRLRGADPISSATSSRPERRRDHRRGLRPAPCSAWCAWSTERVQAAAGAAGIKITRAHSAATALPFDQRFRSGPPDTIPRPFIQDQAMKKIYRHDH